MTLAHMKISVFVIVATMLVAPPVSYAEIGRYLSLEDKLASADSVVHARCVGLSTAWRDGLVITTANYEVLDDLQGTGGATLALIIPGGTAMHPTLGIPVTTRLSNGVSVQLDEEVVLFAKQTATGEWRLSAGRQSYVRVVRDPHGVARVRTEDRQVLTRASTGTSGEQSGEREVAVSSESYSLDAYLDRLRVAIDKEVPQREAE